MGSSWGVLVLGLLSLGLACTHPPRPTTGPARGLSNSSDVSTLPHADKGSFSVAIAAFRGDEDSDRDGEGDTTKRIARYLNAAEELTSSRAPRDFVVVHNQLGLLYRRSSLRSSSAPTLCSAVHEFGKAAEVSFDGDVPRYMDVTLRGLGNSLEDLTRPLPKGQKPDCSPPIDDRVWRTYQATLPK